MAQNWMLPTGRHRSVTAASRNTRSGHWIVGVMARSSGTWPKTQRSRTATWSLPPGKKKSSPTLPTRRLAYGRLTRSTSSTAASKPGSRRLAARASGQHSGCCRRTPPTRTGPLSAKLTSWKWSMPALRMSWSPATPTTAFRGQISRLRANKQFCRAAPMAISTFTPSNGRPMKFDGTLMTSTT